jgi:hypothetical protein
MSSNVPEPNGSGWNDRRPQGPVEFILNCTGDLIQPECTLHRDGNQGVWVCRNVVSICANPDVAAERNHAHNPQHYHNRASVAAISTKLAASRAQTSTMIYLEIPCLQVLRSRVIRSNSLIEFDICGGGACGELARVFSGCTIKKWGDARRIRYYIYSTSHWLYIQ